MISIKQLDDEGGHNVTFIGATWKVTKGAMVVTQANISRTLYMTSSCKDMVVVIDANVN